MSHSQSVPSEAVLYIDFARRQFRWGEESPTSLPDDLAVGMFEQLTRGSTSAARSVLIPRSRPCIARLDAKHTRSAYHHVASTLKLILKRYRFPITLYRHGGRIHLRFDPISVRTNIGDARVLAKEAFRSLGLSEFDGAIRCADQALHKDPDCTMAARTITRVLQIEPDLPGADLVLRAQIAVARAIGRGTATIRRLRGRTDTSNADAIRARDLAQHLLDRMDRHWDAFLSWPFGESTSDHSGSNHRQPLRTFVEHWTDAIRDDVLAFDRFAAHPITIDVRETLVEQQLRKHNLKRRQEDVDDLTHDIFRRLLLWAPTPVKSQQQLKHELVKFLGRRLKWNELLNQRDDRAVELDETFDLPEDDDSGDAGEDDDFGDDDVIE